MKIVEFHGRSLEAIKDFPVVVRRDAGHQLDRVQRGLDPINWKPMKQIGAGVRELRLRDNGQYRVIYLAMHEKAVHVLHAFQKKTRKIRLQDIQIARQAFNKLTSRNHE